MESKVESKQEFINKVRKLSCDQLSELFYKLQADDKTPLGMLMFVSKEYADRYYGLTWKRILK